MFTRAYRDTLRQAGGIGGILFLSVGAFAPYVYIRATGGSDAVIAAWTSALVLLAGFGAAAIAMFLYNLLATPYRLQKEWANSERVRADNLQQQVTLLREKAELHVESMQLAHGGIIQFRGKPMTHITIWLRVTNRGRIPTAALDWHMLADSGKGCEAFQSNPADGVALSVGENDDVITLFHLDAIEEKTSQPIAQGDFRCGFFFTLIEPERLSGMNEVDIVCQQVDGTLIKTPVKLRSGLPSSQPRHLPGTTSPFSEKNRNGK